MKKLRAVLLVLCAVQTHAMDVSEGFQEVLDEQGKKQARSYIPFELQMACLETGKSPEKAKHCQLLQRIFECTYALEVSSDTSKVQREADKLPGYIPELKCPGPGGFAFVQEISSDRDAMYKTDMALFKMRDDLLKKRLEDWAQRWGDRSFGGVSLGMSK